MTAEIMLRSKGLFTPSLFLRATWVKIKETTIAKPTPCPHRDTCAPMHQAGKPRQCFAHDHFHTDPLHFPDVAEDRFLDFDISEMKKNGD